MGLTLGVAFGEVDIWRDCLVLQRQHGFDETCQTRRAFRMANIGFDLICQRFASQVEGCLYLQM